MGRQDERSGSARHGHRSHRDRDADNNNSNKDDRGDRHGHRRSRHHHHQRRGDETDAPSDSAARSHRRPRRERHDDNSDGDADHYRRSRRDATSRRRGGGRREDDTYSNEDVKDRFRDDDVQRSRKRRRGDARSDDDLDNHSNHDDARDRHRRDRHVHHHSRSDIEAEKRELTERLERYKNSGNNSSGATPAVTHTREKVDWSSPRGRQRMPNLAYDVDQQNRFLGFLDRRDATNGRGGGGGGGGGGAASAAAGMDFEIGPDGLVQMPPPNTLVRPQYGRNNHGNRFDRRGDGREGARHQSCPPPSYVDARHLRDGDGTKEGKEREDDNSSVASHESLYHDPALAQMGILPDMLPPSNLYRVALYGVDLSLTTEHLNSVVAQLLESGTKPYRVRRPAREMLSFAVSYGQSTQQQQQPPDTVAAAASSSPASAPSKPVLEHAETDNETVHTAVGDGGVLSDKPLNTDGAAATAAVLADAKGVLSSGAGGSGVLDGTHVLDADDDEAVDGDEAVDEKEGVLPDASSLPLPPPPAAPAVYLPGLHDVNGPGGMVVLEFTEHRHAYEAVKMLNGGYLNGRRIAASS